MKKELKNAVLSLFEQTKDFTLVCETYKGQVFKDTLKRWCYPEEAEKVRLKAKEYHNKNKDNPEYREKRRLQSQERRKTEGYKEYRDQYYEKNKDKMAEVVKEHRQKHLEHYLKKARQNYYNNKDRYREHGKEYYENNKEYLKQLALKQYHNDPLTHLKHNLRTSLNRALKYGDTKKTNKATRLLGCSLNEFKTYIECKFLEGMSWDNRQEWHLDHIIPLSKLKDGYSLEQLCHYTNIRPVWKTDNLSKGNRLDLPVYFSEEELKKEKEFYFNAPGNYLQVPSQNKIVLNFQPHFFDKERTLWANPSIQKKLIDNRFKYLGKTVDELSSKEILRGFKISGIHYGYSHFSPLWMKKFLGDFKVERIYDPCGGWGHRMVGLLGSQVKKYIYNDFDLRTAKGAEKIKAFLGLDSIVEIHNQKAECFIPNSLVDCIFTCPPYFNKETYNDKHFKSLEDFSTWWERVVSNSLKLNPKYFAVVIDNENQKIIESPLAKFPLVLEQKIVKKQSHLNQGTKAKESLLVYEVLG